mmetsp:Transcript_100403/g.289980  ORF Transcript_100403/g.289980 Transcript_100403/m.289980 type:complete len:252 (+) Transcript_100403:374-1129(+)
MFRAVSSLSPVSTQSLMPAARRREIVSPTPTWSLSSMPVAPTSSRFVSSFSATAARSPSLLDCAVCAFSNSECQASYSCVLRRRLPRTNVLKPSCASSVRCAGRLGAEEADRSSMTLSAPFTSTQISPDGLRTTVDIRFLADVKAFTASTVYSLADLADPPRWSTSTHSVCPARLLRFQPNSRTASTRAPSSGLSASYFFVPHWSSVTITVCATARISKKASMASAALAPKALALRTSGAAEKPRLSVTSP